MWKWTHVWRNFHYIYKSPYFKGSKCLTFASTLNCSSYPFSLTEWPCLCSFKSIVTQVYSDLGVLQAFWSWFPPPSANQGSRSGEERAYLLLCSCSCCLFRLTSRLEKLHCKPSGIPHQATGMGKTSSLLSRNLHSTFKTIFHSKDFTHNHFINSTLVDIITISYPKNHMSCESFKYEVPERKIQLSSSLRIIPTIYSFK